MPPNAAALEQQLTIGNSSIGNYVPGANYCKLKVLSAGKTSITVKPLNPPCLTSGEMGNGMMNGTTTWDVNANGWTVQADGSGFLFWQFFAKATRPNTRKTTFNVTVVPAPKICIDSDCSCNEWSCAHDPVCLLAKATSYDSCKCAFIAGDHAEGTWSCRFIALLLRILFWGGIATIALLLIMAAYKRLSQRSSYNKSF
jgi:hypothetical protein